MAETMLISGNEAIARGAIQAGCRYFFGYPITPQSDIPEFMSRELPKVGGVFVQSESETASVYMVYGGGLAGARVMVPRPSWFVPVSVPGGTLIRNWPVLYEPLKGIDKLIGLAPVKDHHRSGASMVMKNWYGLLGGRRNMLHQDIHNTIKELALMVKPSLVVLDGTVTMMRNGPTGGSTADLKQTHQLIVGTDQVAVDQGRLYSSGAYWGRCHSGMTLIQRMVRVCRARGPQSIQVTPFSGFALPGLSSAVE